MFSKQKLFSLLVVLVLTFMAVAPVNVMAWESSGATNPTHSFLVEKAVQILENDLGTTITSDPNFGKLKSYLYKLKEGSLAPDNLSNVALGGLSEGDWWSSHFYDPDINATYSSSTPGIHAEYQTRRFINMAVTEWKNGNYSQAVYLLGYASHFFADLCNPHHASNKTVFDSPYNHGDFESYVQERQNNYVITTAVEGSNTVSSTYSSTVNNFNTMNAFVTDLSKRYGKVAKNNYYAYANTTNTATWNSAAITTVANSQRGLALIYYRFLQELNLVKKLTVTVKTADVLWAGTDDNIYFGMTTDYGAAREFLLDKKSDMLDGAYKINTVNDFEQGNTDFYNIYFYDKSFDLSRVNKLTIRKGIYILSDDWKADYVDISLNNTPVMYKSLNRWFYGNTQYDWAINGLNVNNPSYIGSYNVTIKTADVMWAGTDDNIYFGMSLDDGRKVEYLCDKSYYNDFERNNNDTYTFTITDPSFQASQIRNIWLRKSKILGDDWKVYSISINMRGKVVFSKTINQWLEGNTTYNMPVNGLFY